jgi:branched-chain amino acid aminotransferase
MSTGKILGEKYIINGKAADVSGFIPDMSADIYYEVLRMIDGKLLFLHDHLDRLQNSLAGSGIVFPGKDTLRHNLSLLLERNSFTHGNIRICLQPSTENGFDLICYFVPYVYPDAIMYKEGVQLVTYPYIRSNPGIKKWDDRFRSSVGQFIREKGVYEAVLLNNDGQITEGSRSNLFFIDQQGKLVTVPEKAILPGITRKYVLEIAEKNDIPIIEKSVPLNSLDSQVSAFISGTSPKVLPVKTLDKYRFDVSHPVLQLLMEQFELLIQDNLSGILD